MPARILLAALLALLAVPAAPAAAAEPILPLGEVRSGMRCTGYSVVRGTEVSAFDVEILDVVDGDPALGGPRILIRVSGPAVDETGIGPGFSGSPVKCPGPDGVARTVGAISESVGEYGGKVALASPIEAILGTPVEAPRARDAKGLASRARPLAAPLTVTGASAPVARLLSGVGQRAGRPVLAVPAGPLGAYPVQTLRPGAAMAVGYADGDLRVGAVGTVAYTDGGQVWGFGHPFEAAGRRALLLQDAYVFRVISNPNTGGEMGSTYKLAAPGHAVGTLTNDALAAVTGRLGALPSTVPVQVRVTDTDTNARRALDVRVADETDVEYPTGPNLPFVAPLAVVQGVTGVLAGQPAKLTLEMCARLVLRERRAPLRFCNRYLGAASASEGELGSEATLGAALDLLQALASVESYERATLHVTGVSADVEVMRGTRELLLRSLRLPARVRAGQRVRVRLDVQRPRGERRTLSVAWRVPGWLKPGRRKLTVRGVDPKVDSELVEALAEELGQAPGDELSHEEEPRGREEAPRSVEGVARQVRRLSRYDGLVVRAGRVRAPFYRDPDYRITGKASAQVRVLRQSR